MALLFGIQGWEWNMKYIKLLIKHTILNKKLLWCRELKTTLFKIVFSDFPCT